jgi:SAM-dependent methyltransferase
VRPPRSRMRLHRPAELGPADAELMETLHSLDGALNYRDWILALAGPHLEGAGRIIELGAGHGTFTAQLAAIAPTTAVEPGPRAFARLEQRFGEDPRIEVLQGDASGLPDGGFDVAFLSNVLEHIEDDVEALQHLVRSLRPGGRVVVFSPAFDLLYSRFDAMVGHHHRYRLGELRERFERAGLEVVDARYVNLPGWFLWLIYVRLLGRVPTRPVTALAYDRYVVPALRRIERVIRPPFGQSVLCVGRRP